MASIFLSHSSKDKPFVRRLASDLQVAGHTVWIDEAEINVGDSLIAKIQQGLDRVDYVAAILSTSSIKSSWVERELDIASNKEISQKRVVVLPILIEEVEIPTFLVGKLYADFCKEENYITSFERLLKALGNSTPVVTPPDNLDDIKAQLEDALKQIKLHTKDKERKNRILSSNWSDDLKNAVKEANIKFPHHRPINEAYAFEVLETVVTLDYLLWGISKSKRQGAHILEVILTIGDKWQEAEYMISAYNDYLDSIS